MICHNHKFIFIHIPKTGGTSIQHALGNENTSTVRHGHHGRLYEYLAKYGPEIIDDYFKFTVIRNPWDVEVSAYFFNRQYKGSIRQWRRNPYWWCLNKFCRTHTFSEYILSNLWFTDAKYQRFFEIDGQQRMDYFIQFDQLQEDFDTVCEKLGIDTTELPRCNTSRHKHFTQYYNRRTRDFVAKRYAKLIKQFGFSCELK